MSKFLYVYGSDYCARYFEEYFDVKEVYSEMVDTGVTETVLKFKHPEAGEDEDFENIEVKLLKFDDVDPKFVKFVLSELCDDDMLNDAKIYRVEE